MRLKPPYLSVLLHLLFALIVFTGCEKKEDEDKTLKDIDGNEYNTIKIGDQVWMAENLKTTTYKDGTPIDLVLHNSQWEYTINGAYCYSSDWWGEEAGYVNAFGNLYNWIAVITGNLCPDGWHVATDNDWKYLEMTMGMTAEHANITGWRGINEGSKLAGNEELWNDGVLEYDIEFAFSGFEALPAGSRNYLGLFDNIMGYGYWWTATNKDENNAWYRFMYFNSKRINRNAGEIRAGYSVRCVKDD